MDVVVDIEYDDVELESARLVSGIRATCSRCGHEEECAGTDSAAAGRACARMKQHCPQRQRNNYYAPDA